MLILPIHHYNSRLMEVPMKFVKLLLESGANDDVQSKGGDVILYSAVVNGDSVIITNYY